MSLTMFDVGNTSPCTCGSISTCEICTTVTTCGGTVPVASALVTVSQGGSTVGTCTTNSSGYCCIAGLTAGTYTVSVAKTGSNGSNTTVTITCPGTTNVSLICNPTLGPHADFYVGGCNELALPGASVSITGPGGGGSGTTDASGHAGPLALTNGTYTWNASAPRFVSQTGTCTISGCTGGCMISITLLPATGYVCFGSGCAYPYKTTMYLTLPVGSVTMTYSGGPWNGSGSYTGPACNSLCNPSGTGSVPYDVSYVPGSVYLTITMGANAYLTCFCTSGLCTACFTVGELWASGITGYSTPNPVCPDVNPTGLFTDEGTITGLPTSGFGSALSNLNGSWTLTE